MTIVALETSTRSGSVAVAHGAATAELALDPGSSHARDLLPALQEALARVGARPGSIEAVLVGTGPGSYTGLRVGIATALGLACAPGVALRGVPSGEALIAGELEPGREGVYLVDARQGEIYLARYRRTAADVETVVAPCVLAPEAVPPHLAGDATVFGHAGVASAARLDAATAARVRVDAVPRAAAVLALGRARLARLGPEAPADVAPLYLRPFAARVRRR